MTPLLETQGQVCYGCGVRPSINGGYLMSDVTTQDGAKCTEEQVKAIKLLQRAIKSVAEGHTLSFALAEVGPAGRLRSTAISIDGGHLDKLAHAVRQQSDELMILGSLWEGNAPLTARSVRRQ